VHGEGMTLITIVVVVVVVAAGLTYNRRVWRPRQATAAVPRDGLKVSELVAPITAVPPTSL